jgi:hypothetical protein
MHEKNMKQNQIQIHQNKFKFQVKTKKGLHVQRW